jgi:hypothetical protein
MIRLMSIVFTFLGLFSCLVLAYADEEINLYEMAITQWYQKAAPADQPLSFLTAEVDEVVDGVNRGKTIDPEEDKAKTPMKKKRNLENKQKSRMVPLKPAPPSETIKADQEVDFPYDI